MRVFGLWGVAVAAIAFSASAQAASSDLVFCSKLPSQPERLACYDAAARIAETKPSATKQSPAVYAVPTGAAAGSYAKAPIQVPAITPARPFHGAHVAVGGSFGVGERVISTDLPLQPQGFSGLASVGYTVQVDHLVAGVELRGRYGKEGDDRLAVVTTGFGPGHGVILSTKRNTDAGFHALARLGMAVDQTLMFGYGGFGASHHEAIFSNVPFGPFPLVVTSPYLDATAWLPSTLFGIGIEHNFGRAFLRATAEMEAMRSATTAEFIWTTRAIGMAGYRF